MTWFGSISFGAPWILLGLLALPAIWFLLRVTPPSPRREVFPPLRLLLGLKSREETPARTPWWLLLLRLVAAACIILALAEPLFGTPHRLAGAGPLVLFVDNGWTAAHDWPARKRAMAEAVSAAAHDGRAVAVLATADRPDTSLMDAGRAARALAALHPEPWRADRADALAALGKAKFAVRPHILWFSDGIEDGHAMETARTLVKLGALTIYGGKGPLALLPAQNDASGFTVTVLRAKRGRARSGTVSAQGPRGELLASAPFRFARDATRAEARIALPLEVRNKTAMIVIDGEDSAGAVQLLDQGAPRRAVGLVAAAGDEEQPLLSGIYYLERALQPYADVEKGTISGLLAKNVSVLMLSDVGKIAGADYAAVSDFVKKGGLLVRFAGARMANGTDDLVPVKLRSGGRYLGGALAWAAPQHLAPFPETSPFAGLAVPGDVTVSRQILAEPSIELSTRAWARLADGTPLVTAAPRGKGYIVLFHITAGPAWSSLPLSGLYVDMLRRLLALGAGVRPEALSGNASLPAAETLDGFGRLHPAPADIRPVRGRDFAGLDAGPAHPPGFYGAEGAELALNAVKASDHLLPMGDVGPVESFAGASVTALEPPLLAIAALLLLADALIGLVLRGYLGLPRMLRGAAVLLACALIAPHARADEAFDLKAALDTRLAYVVTGLPDVDAMSRAGLTGLGEALKARTSYEPEPPMGVNIETDDLSFFPLLYWPMDPREKDLSPKALSKIADYMRSGGTILFDTRDLTLGAVAGPNNPGEQTLKRLLSKLDLPPLEPVPPDHVLTKAFYLLRDFPGRWDSGKVWVEALPPPDPDAGPEPARGGDNVSPVIIGPNDWAAAWAVDQSGRPLADVSPGGPRQREMAIRFGINLVMYALTGNYKTDQVHVPALLERLGHEGPP